MAKKSFWQKITGAVKAEEYEYEDFDEFEEEREDDLQGYPDEDVAQSGMIEDNLLMELPVDVYHDAENIYIEAFIPGIQLNDLNIELSRELISISGSRQASRDLDSTEYFANELEWGEFSRSLTLPEEVDIDSSSATESNGVLKIVLPKFNKLRKAKLIVKSAKH